MQGAQSWGSHSLVVTWKSHVLRSEGFPPPPSSPASANAVWTCTNLSQPSSLTDSNKQDPLGVQSPAGVLPLTCHPDMQPQLLACWFPAPVSRADRWLLPFPRPFLFLTLLPPMPTYSSCDGGLPAPAPPCCLGSSDHKRKDAKEWCPLASPSPPGRESRLGFITRPAFLYLNRPHPLLLLDCQIHLPRASFRNDDDIFQTFKKYVHNKPFCAYDPCLGDKTFQIT